MSTMQPSELILELSHNCNLSCIMCGFVKERNRPEYFMTEQTLDQVMDAFTHAPQVVRLNGRGESTIHPQFPAYLEKIRARWPSAALHLFTNLNIKDTSRVELLRSCGVQLFISIDSPDAGELARIRKGVRWEYVEHNLRLLGGHEPRPFFIFTIQKENIHRLLDMAKLAEVYNFGLIYNVVRSDLPDYRLLNQVISDLPAIREKFQTAGQLLKAKGLPCLIPDQLQGVSLDLPDAVQSNGTRSVCPALKRETCIQFDGYVTPCNMFHPKKFGHVRDGSITQVLDSSVARVFRQTHKTDDYCQNCAWLGGGE